MLLPNIQLILTDKLILKKKVIPHDKSGLFIICVVYASYIPLKFTEKNMFQLTLLCRIDN